MDVGNLNVFSRFRGGGSGGGCDRCVVRLGPMGASRWGGDGEVWVARVVGSVG